MGKDKPRESILAPSYWTDVLNVELGWFLRMPGLAILYKNLLDTYAHPKS